MRNRRRRAKVLLPVIALLLLCWGYSLHRKSQHRERVVARVIALGGRVVRKPDIIESLLKALGRTKDFGPVQGIGLGNVSNLTVADLELVGQLVELESVGLEGSNVTDDGLAQLRGLTRLRGLSVRKTMITGAGFAKFPPLQQLEHLNASQSRLDDSSLKFIARFPNLREINLRLTFVTGQTLPELQTLNKLGDLDLRSTDVSLEDFQQSFEIGRTGLQYGVRPKTTIYLLDPDPTESKLANARAEFPHIDFQVFPMWGELVLHPSGLRMHAGSINWQGLSE